MSAQASPLALATALARAAGLPDAVAVERLLGGKNNRVFSVRLPDAATLILKLYHRHPNDPRDRLDTEWNFLRYARRRGIETVPEPLALDRSTGAALYSCLPGRKLAAHEIDASHVVAARDFIIALNQSPRDLAGLRNGSEACFSLAEHLATVDRRVARLNDLAPATSFHIEAEALVRNRLVPLWAGIKARLREAAETGETRLGQDDIIVSPSDFGFHNILSSTDGTLTFLDFEYAGLDDPAKLAGDLFSVPEIPVPARYFDAFVEGLADALHLGESFVSRARLLFDVYRIKWACIILNDFLAQEAERRDFALGEEKATRYRLQLDKAAAKIAEFSLD